VMADDFVVSPPAFVLLARSYRSILLAMWFVHLRDRLSVLARARLAARPVERFVPPPPLLSPPPLAPAVTAPTSLSSTRPPLSHLALPLAAGPSTSGSRAAALYAHPLPPLTLCWESVARASGPSGGASLASSSALSGALQQRSFPRSPSLSPSQSPAAPPHSCPTPDGRYRTLSVNLRCPRDAAAVLTGPRGYNSGEATRRPHGRRRSIAQLCMAAKPITSTSEEDGNAAVPDAGDGLQPHALTARSWSVEAARKASRDDASESDSPRVRQHSVH